ncbi:MAG TPA: sensor histidine kinase [Verrucomicrobiae bacterium]|jgi:signal transduction histidine kinase
MSRATAILAPIVLVVILCSPARAAVLWQNVGPILAHENGEGTDILQAAVSRDNTASDALYFKFHVNPLSDASMEPYSAGFQLFLGDQERLGVGNSLEAWAYSAFNTLETGTNKKVPGDVDLHSASPESYEPGRYLSYEFPRRGFERTIVFKVQFVPGGEDLVTVWMNPRLTPGATEENQLTNLVTQFKANASFNQIHLRHHGNGDGWVFSDLAVATSFDDFIVIPFWETWWFRTMVAAGLMVWVVGVVRVMERRKYLRQLQLAEQERTLERERARIAQDLHDDLGSSLTRLTLLSGLVKADKDNPEQVEAHASKLSQAADQTVRALEEIVWAVRPGSDTLQSLMDYIAHFANELFDGSSARCRLDLPNDLPAWPLPPDMRHNIFLIVKEALTNAFKHSGAGEVQVRAKIIGRTLEISVVDDGKGFNPASLVEGWRNGMGNLRRRAAAMSAKLDLQSEPGKGTTVRFSVGLEGDKEAKRGK